MVFAYKDDKTRVNEVSKEIKNTRKPGVEAPKTGDTTDFWLPAAVVALSLAGITVVLLRMRKKKKS